ncbi:MAG: MFS transporter, partial [bacterium]
MTKEKDSPKGEKARSRFHPLFWLVIVFEFFERGSYYGMMSVLSVYMTDHLHFAKTDVGLIKSTIQPLLYFLPIISGALADRFGFRRTLMVAFALLGTGYFLTSQATGYAAVFLSLVVMGVGAGTFKPVISGSIARCTDETNSTLGFGIFYWTINLGAFLFPLFLVPFLKNNIGWEWVIIAAAIGTGAMLLPTVLFFREPPKPKETGTEKKTNLLQTLANAFEIIYSPVVLLVALMRRYRVAVVIIAVALLGLLGAGIRTYLEPGQDRTTLSARRVTFGNTSLLFKVERNLCLPAPYTIVGNGNKRQIKLTLSDPDRFPRLSEKLLERLRSYSGDGAIYVAGLADVRTKQLDQFRSLRGLETLDKPQLEALKNKAAERINLLVVVDRSQGKPFTLERRSQDHWVLTLQSPKAATTHRSAIRAALAARPELATLSKDKLDELIAKARSHSFLLLFVGLLILCAFVIVHIAPRFKAAAALPSRLALMALVMVPLALVIWLLPNLSLFARVLCSFISLTLLSLYEIRTDDLAKYKDHARFLLMIGIYSGFWVMYFQMFDAVLWYTQAYVDAGSLNNAVNGAAAALGVNLNWRFDVEHVTVINAGTIIALQLLISYIVKNTRALPT